MKASDPAGRGAVDCISAEHYRWGDACDGWRLLQHPDLSVIRERVPPGASEVAHHHRHARQFFYVLSGTATLEFDDGSCEFGAGQGVHVAPGIVHRFVNRSQQEVFLVISSPTTTGDRVACSTGDASCADGASELT